MRLWKKKEKKRERQRKAMENFQELFEQNMHYISQTSLNAEDIARQFVKSQSRFYLTVGEIDCPSGRIIVSDPLCYLASNEICPQLSLNIPTGTYPVQVSIFRNQDIGIRMCTARLKIKNTSAVSYHCAEPTAESAAAAFSDGILTGFPVDAGMISFCDAQVAKEYQLFLKRWHQEHEGKNHYDDYFGHFFAESAKKLPAYQRADGDFLEWTNPDSGNKMVMVASGFGDGFYQCFWGYDEQEKLCELVVPMINPDLFESP